MSTATRNFVSGDIFKTAFAAFVLLAVVVALSVVGRCARHVAESRTVQIVSDPKQAFFLWRNAGVRGRILICFERHPGIEEMPQDLIEKALDSSATSSEVSDANFLYLSFQAGIIRKMYQIVPESAWEKVSNLLSQNPAASSAGGRHFRLTIDGVPIIVTTLQNMPRLDEPALVYFNKAYRGLYDAEATRPFLEDPRLSDFLVLVEDGGAGK